MERTLRISWEHIPTTDGENLTYVLRAHPYYRWREPYVCPGCEHIPTTDGENLTYVLGVSTDRQRRNLTRSTLWMWVYRYLFKRQNRFLDTYTVSVAIPTIFWHSSETGKKSVHVGTPPGTYGERCLLCGTMEYGHQRDTPYEIQGEVRQKFSLYLSCAAQVCLITAS